MEKNELHLRFAELDQAKDEMEAKLKDIKKELETMSDALVNQFMDQQIQKISIKGGVTLRLDCKIWPKKKDGVSTPEVVNAIKAAGMPELLVKENYQTQSLAAYLRELDKSGESLPPELSAVIEPNPVYKIIATKN